MLNKLETSNANQHSWSNRTPTPIHGCSSFLPQKVILCACFWHRWISGNLGMVTLLGSQIWWTWETEDVFDQVHNGNKHAMKEFGQKLTSHLTDLTTMVRGSLSEEDRKKVNTLIIIDVHARDIISTFVRDSVMDAREFAWESQLRFYWDRTMVSQQRLL